MASGSPVPQTLYMQELCALTPRPVGSIHLGSCHTDTALSHGAEMAF